MNSTEQPIVNKPETDELAWSSTTRMVVSALLVGYLFMVVIGPLANPVGSKHLTTPLSNFFRPAHQALFTGHGYRFFGPDPGPSHLLIYKVQKSDGVQIEGRFPNRNEHWPRLLYHRWFMLSERVYEEHLLTLDTESHRNTIAEYDRRLEQLKKEGLATRASQLAAERDQQVESYKQTRSRIDAVVTAIGNHVLEKHDGQSVELFLQERVIALPDDIALGKKISDRSYLTPEVKIFETSKDGSKKSVEEIHPLVPAPSQSEVKQ